MHYGHKVDTAVLLSLALFKRYTCHVAAQLGARPLGARVVTYARLVLKLDTVCYEAAMAQEDIVMQARFELRHI